MAKDTKPKKDEIEKTSEIVATHLDKLSAGELATQAELDAKITEAQQLKKTIQAFILGHDLTSKLKKEQIDMCEQTALSFGLNPLKREIHFVPRAIKKQVNGQWITDGYDVNIIVGYEVYLKRAEATGRLSGWGVVFEQAKTFTNQSDMKAIITIYKKGWEKPFIHEVYLSEARQDRSPVWEKMPKFQLRKVAISQGFRLAFPEEIGGMPYIPEEIGLGQTDGDGNFTEEKTEQPKAIAPLTKKITEKQAENIMNLLEAKGKTLDDLVYAIGVAFKKKNLIDLTDIEAEKLLVKLNSLPNKEDAIDVDEVDEKIEKQKEEGVKNGK